MPLMRARDAVDARERLRTARARTMPCDAAHADASEARDPRVVCQKMLCARGSARQDQRGAMARVARLMADARFW